MFKTAFTIEFFGGSRDGEVNQASDVPYYYLVAVDRNIDEIYERQTDEAPFVYALIGYGENEILK